MARKFKVTRMTWKGIKAFLFYAVPWAIAEVIKAKPALMSLTIGTILMMASNLFKHKNGF